MLTSPVHDMQGTAPTISHLSKARSQNAIIFTVQPRRGFLAQNLVMGRVIPSETLIDRGSSIFEPRKGRAVPLSAYRLGSMSLRRAYTPRSLRLEPGALARRGWL